MPQNDLFFLPLLLPLSPWPLFPVHHSFPNMAYEEQRARPRKGKLFLFPSPVFLFQPNRKVRRDHNFEFSPPNKTRFFRFTRSSIRKRIPAPSINQVDEGERGIEEEIGSGSACVSEGFQSHASFFRWNKKKLKHSTQ